MGSFCCCLGRKVIPHAGQANWPSRNELPDRLPPPRVPTPPSTSQFDVLPPAMSWGAVSQFSRPEDAAMMRSIFQPEDDASDAGSAHFTKPKPYKDTLTLGTVKEKLKQRLSKDSLLNRRSQGLILDSEEEVARKAELRRVRHERIKEELANKDSYDADAKSMITNKSSHTRGNEALESATDGLKSFSDYDDRVSIEQATRVVIHSRQRSEVTLQSIPKKQSDDFLHTTTKNRSGSIISRRHSSNDLQELLRSDTTLTIWRNSEGGSQGTVPIAPLAPQLKPQRMPSIADSIVRRHSWWLSHVEHRSPNRLHQSGVHTSRLDSLFQDRRAASKTIELRWLRSQGMRVSTPRHPVAGDLAIYSGQLTHINSFGGVDGTGSDGALSAEMTSDDSVHPKELENLSKLASMTSHDSGIVNISADNPFAVDTNHPEAYPVIDGRQKATQGFLQNCYYSSRLFSETLSTLSRRFDSGQDADFSNGLYMDGTSQSSYATGANLKFDLANSMSAGKTHSLLGTPILNGVEYRPFNVLVKNNFGFVPLASKNELEILSNFSIASPSGNALNFSHGFLSNKKVPRIYKKEHRLNRRFTIDSTLSISDTSSYYHSESELGHVLKRFPISISRSLPVNSRFTEIFDDDDSTPQIRPYNRISMFHSLQLKKSPFEIETEAKTGDDCVAGNSKRTPPTSTTSFWPKYRGENKSNRVPVVDPQDRRVSLPEGNQRFSANCSFPLPITGMNLGLTGVVKPCAPSSDNIVDNARNRSVLGQTEGLDI